jgi:hypothetical protein
MSIPIYPEINEVLQTDTFEDWRNKTNKIKLHSDYIEVIFGNWSGLKTTNKDTFVNSLNETYDYVVSNDNRIQSLETKQANAFRYIGLELNGDYIAIGPNYTSSDVIKTNINTLDIKLKETNDTLNGTINLLHNTITNVDTIESNVGLNSDGIYTSGVYNIYSTTDNIKTDINLLDTEIVAFRSEYHDKVDIEHTNKINTIFTENGVIRTNIVDIDNRMDNMIESIGLSVDTVNSETGTYYSEPLNAIANKNNIKEDIHALDYKLDNLPTGVDSGGGDHSHDVYWVDIINRPSVGDNSSEFATGTTLLFYQSFVPLGWTLYTGVNDSILRVVKTKSDGGDTNHGGASASTIFTHTHTHDLKMSGYTDYHNLSKTEMPKHNHATNMRSQTGSNGWPNVFDDQDLMTEVPSGDRLDHKHENSIYSTNTSFVGSGAGHRHSLVSSFTGNVKQLTITPKYSNVIMCVKD